MKFTIFLLLYQPPYCLAASLPKLLEASQPCQWSSASPGRFQSAGLDLRKSLEVHGHHDSHAPVSVIHSRCKLLHLKPSMAKVQGIWGAFFPPMGLSCLTLIGRKGLLWVLSAKELWLEGSRGRKCSATTPTSCCRITFSLLAFRKVLKLGYAARHKTLKEKLLAWSD